MEFSEASKVVSWIGKQYGAQYIEEDLGYRLREDAAGVCVATIGRIGDADYIPLIKYVITPTGMHKLDRKLTKALKMTGKTVEKENILLEVVNEDPLLVRLTYPIFQVTNELDPKKIEDRLFFHASVLAMLIMQVPFNRNLWDPIK